MDDHPSAANHPTTPHRDETALWGDWQLYALISLKRLRALHGDFEQGAHLR